MEDWGEKKKMVVRKRFSGETGQKREDDRRNGNNGRIGKKRKSQKREKDRENNNLRCREIERKRENVGNIENQQRA